MAPDAPIIGRTLGGRFRVTAFIGEGGMAAVYRAEQEAEPREVAVKILHPHLVSDATFVARFRREARAAARVVHPCSVRILDTGVDGRLLYIAMELLGGQDLFETLVLERQLSEARAVAIVAQVADALAAAHAQGVIHRDLKPENIMLVPTGDRGAPVSSGNPVGFPQAPTEAVKVLDFGIAKVLERDFKTSSDGLPSMYPALTGVDTVVGTPAYMSPEQCRGEAVDHTSDLYACGVLLYQLVSGRLPFTAASTMDVAVMHVKTPPTPLASVVPSVNPRLAALVHKALAKWPAERPQSAVELAAELRAILPDASPGKLPTHEGVVPEAPAERVTSEAERAPTLLREVAQDAAPPSVDPSERETAIPAIEGSPPPPLPIPAAHVEALLEAPRASGAVPVLFVIAGLFAFLVLLAIAAAIAAAILGG